MIGFGLSKFIDDSAAVLEAEKRATNRALAKAAYAIFRDARASIERDDKPGPAGGPPHSRRGQLPRAIRYDVDKAAQSAVIGPQASQVGPSGEAHEFGGEFRGEQYPQRPFMGPALERNKDKIPTFWSAEITN